MTPQGPLSRRIAERKDQERKSPKPPVAAWRRWVEENKSAKDMTGTAA